jgi:sulfate permease, SulP family
VYRFGADLFYANADRFADQVRGLVAGAPEPVRWFVIDCAPIFDLDFTAARTVRDLIAELTRAKVGLVLARVNEYLHSDLVRHRVAAVVGEERIFDTLHEAIAAVGPGGRLAGGTKSSLTG